MFRWWSTRSRLIHAGLLSTETFISGRPYHSKADYSALEKVPGRSFSCTLGTCSIQWLLVSQTILAILLCVITILWSLGDACCSLFSIAESTSAWKGGSPSPSPSSWLMYTRESLFQWTVLVIEQSSLTTNRCLCVSAKDLPSISGNSVYFSLPTTDPVVVHSLSKRTFERTSMFSLIHDFEESICPSVRPFHPG